MTRTTGGMEITDSLIIARYKVILTVGKEVEPMGQVKTGISLDAELFEAAERLAQELHLTRSALYARALEELIERRRSKDLLDELNAAYGGPPDPEDDALMRGIQRTMRRVAEPWE